MASSRFLRIIIDSLMAISLFMLMGYHLWHGALHEAAGLFLFAAAAAHNALNRNWYRSLLKGRYTPLRVMTAAINLAIAAIIVLQIYSGLAMSQYLFTLPMPTAFARRFHLAGAYWLFILAGFHFGLHWNGFMRKMQRRRIVMAILLSISAYGILAFARRGFPGIMLLLTEYASFDYDEPILLFVLDYLSIFILSGTAAFLLRRRISKR